jgi:hypothetical protein
VAALLLASAGSEHAVTGRRAVSAVGCLLNVNAGVLLARVAMPSFSRKEVRSGLMEGCKPFVARSLC